MASAREEGDEGIAAAKCPLTATGQMGRKGLELVRPSATIVRGVACRWSRCKGAREGARPEVARRGC